jgi:hypothetical protein
MNLTESQYELLFNRSIYRDLLTNKETTEQKLSGIVASYLMQFGIPTKSNVLATSDYNGDLNGKYMTKEKVIELYSEHIGNNNFQFFHSLIHESTHLMQYFLMKNGISRNTIDDITLDKYQKMCQKFYKDKSIRVDDSMLQNLKRFVKTCPFLDNEVLKCIVQDNCKYSEKEEIYNNNVAEIMSNYFAIDIINTVVKEHGITNVQANQIRKCFDVDLRKFSGINPDLKARNNLDVNFNIFIDRHIGHLSILAKMKLSPIIHDSKQIMDRIEQDCSVMLENAIESIEVYKKQLDDKNNIADIMENVDEKEAMSHQKETSIIDDVLEDDKLPNITTPRDSMNIEK